MKPVLLIDFGSTYTKVTSIDAETGYLYGTAQSFTTVEEDISIGLENALGEKFDPFVYTDYLEKKYGEIYGL